MNDAQNISRHILNSQTQVETLFFAFKLEAPGTANINVWVVALAFRLEVPGNAQINVTIA